MGLHACTGHRYRVRSANPLGDPPHCAWPGSRPSCRCGCCPRSALLHQLGQTGQKYITPTASLGACLQVAAFLPLRLVGSLIASYLILAEKLDNVWEGAGAGLVLVTLSVYLYVQKRHADQQAITVLMEEAAVEEA